MRARTRVLTFAVLAASQWACASSSTQRNQADTSQVAATPVDSAAAATLAPSINAFGCALYRELAVKPGNLILSPFSVSAVMGSVYAGASGATRVEMQSALHLPPGERSVYEGYRELFAGLDSRARAGGAQWTLANRAWVQSGMHLLPEFVGTAREQFGYEIGEANFSGQPDSARVSINRWVEEKTENRIQDLFPLGSIGSDMRLVLANAIYFKGLWSHPFDKQQTRLTTFHAKPITSMSRGVRLTRSEKVPMMFLSRRFGLARVAGARVLELPYKGEQLSMLVLLPDEIGGLAGLEKRLSGDSLRAWVSAIHERQVQVGLPRFTATKDFNLTQTLAGMGLRSAFDASMADFSGMTGRRDLYIGVVVHKAFVEVNEEGTEAAAATGGGMATTSIQMPEEFIADHPFLFLIRDRSTGCVLFLGRLVDPRL